MGPSCEMETEREQPVLRQGSPDQIQSEKGSQTDCEGEEEKGQREARNTSWRRRRRCERNSKAGAVATGTERRPRRRRRR